ncbi:MAG: hypothetical protein IT226_06115 [Flavobacteriales bacterium]|nr:hypothetical protein [Flavobacteriales bacterium]
MNSKLIILIIAVIIVGCAIAWARWGRPVGSGEQNISPDTADFPPKPKWKPTVPVDIARTVETFAYYSNRKQTFAVFTHGTCVLLPDSSKDAEKDAKEILDKVYQYHPDFNPQAMDDGHFVISYSQPAYSVVFKEELEANRAYIDQNHLNGVVRDEVLLNANREPNKFDDMGKIGLFGRARMFLDAQDPVVVQVWRPQ